jgi:hypothetical protein
MISAMNENGGNTLHRMFDGHPQLFVYPFESQLGTRTTSDYLSSLFQHKYRWPQFPLEGTIADDYELIWDQELKTRIKAPRFSKFAEYDIDLSDSERKRIFLELMRNRRRSRENIVEAFFKATFQAYRNYKKTGEEQSYLGYSPCVVVDTDAILGDFPDAKVIHIVRNPFSAYADTKRRSVPQALTRYVSEWNIVQTFALGLQVRYPENVVVVQFEDLAEDHQKFFRALCRKIGISYSSTLMYPSWNGQRLKEVYPWGTIRQVSVEANVKTARELHKGEVEEIRLRTAPVLKLLGFRDILRRI